MAYICIVELRESNQPVTDSLNIMKANNYDTNSKGLNIEVNIFSDFTNEEFNTNITKLKDGNYFLNAQEFDHNSLGFNLKGTNDALLSYLKDYTNVTDEMLSMDNDSLIDEVLEVFPRNIELDNLIECTKELEDYNISIVCDKELRTIETRGYSQGDYALVYYLAEIREHWVNITDENEYSYLSDILECYFWRSEVQGTIEINDSEYYVGEYLNNSYYYEKEELITNLVNHIENNNSENINIELLKEYLEDILPSEVY